MKNAAGDGEELKAIWAAVDEAWRERATEVQEFGLVALRDQIEHAATGWTVPVITKVQTGSAYRLIQILNLLQESIENKTNLWITLYLDPFADTTKNGDN